MFARKKDIWIIAGILVVAFAVWGIFYGMQQISASEAQIVYDGKIVLHVSLNENREFSIPEDPTVFFCVKDGAISFVDATCPDKICEHTGFLSKVGQTAACLPKKTLLKIVGENQPDVDIIAN